MDPFNELERLAQNALPSVSPPASESQVTRWAKIFHTTPTTALSMLDSWKSDFCRFSVPDEHWELVKAEQEARGYDRDAYEFELSMGVKALPIQEKKGKSGERESTMENEGTTYLLKLETPLGSAEAVKDVLGLEVDVTTGTTDEDEEIHRFIRLSLPSKLILQTWIGSKHPMFKPTFIRIPIARKDFDTWSVYPTLGIESTLPQHRLDSFSYSSDPASNRGAGDGLRPTPNKIERDGGVFYFFYGTLSLPETLSRVLERHVTSSSTTAPSSTSSTSPPTLELHKATINHAILRTIGGGKYKALIDGEEKDTVEGMAYRVESEEDERKLREYETDLYEVVRCTITFRSGQKVEGEKKVKGCTFRLAR